jgi:hypothetical protein
MTITLYECDMLFGTTFLQSFKIIGLGGVLGPPASPLVSATGNVDNSSISERDATT